MEMAEIYPIKEYWLYRKVNFVMKCLKYIIIRCVN